MALDELTFTSNKTKNVVEIEKLFGSTHYRIKM